MKDGGLSRASPQAHSIAQRIRHWWRHPDGTERYLAEAADLADLERRMRDLERASGGPVLVTFNH